MGVDTKGCVVTGNKDVFSVVEVIKCWWSNQMRLNGKTVRDGWVKTHRGSHQ